MKFFFECVSCGATIKSFEEWFKSEQRCFKCNSEYCEIKYEEFDKRLVKAFAKYGENYKGMWAYFDILPLIDEKNIVTAGEGDVGVVRWRFLEEFSDKEHGISCTVYVHRHDNNNATGSFKDLAGSMVASILKENQIWNYVVASTGNIGVAYARYISAYGGIVYVFIPGKSPAFQEAEVTIFGQKVFRVDGDYSKAKRAAIEFGNKHNFIVSSGTYDPIRVEAKKTMAYEWFRNLDRFPNVYIQALSGGTGPIGIMKGCKELIDNNLISELPRLILVQSNRCSPMAEAWSEAKSKGFKTRWERCYPVYASPDTQIQTLATGNPTAYPVVASLVKATGGDILAFPEDYVYDIARIVGYETAVRIGPAASIGVGGFFVALKNNLIKNDDVILINVGEGVRRAPDFMIKCSNQGYLSYQNGQYVLFKREEYRKKAWQNIKSEYGRE